MLVQRGWSEGVFDSGGCLDYCLFFVVLHGVP